VDFHGDGFGEMGRLEAAPGENEHDLSAFFRDPSRSGELLQGCEGRRGFGLAEKALRAAQLPLGLEHFLVRHGEKQALMVADQAKNGIPGRRGWVGDGVGDRPDFGRSYRSSPAANAAARGAQPRAWTPTKVG
jgi:hypothetical protein